MAQQTRKAKQDPKPKRREPAPRIAFTAGFFDPSKAKPLPQPPAQPGLTREEIALLLWVFGGSVLRPLPRLIGSLESLSPDQQAGEVQHLATRMSAYNKEVGEEIRAALHCADLFMVEAYK